MFLFSWVRLTNEGFIPAKVYTTLEGKGSHAAMEVVSWVSRMSRSFSRLLFYKCTYVPYYIASVLDKWDP